MKSMKMKEVKIIKSVLSKKIGWSWSIFLIKCLHRSRWIFGSTTWAKKEGAKADFAKRLSFGSALYLELQKKFDKEKAFEITKNILVRIGCDEQWENLNSLGVSDKGPMERLLVFYAFMGTSGVGNFVNRKLVKANINILHYEVRNCLFVRFYKEVGTPELAKLFCEVDRNFFPDAFPEFRFHRGDSWENTEAYGKNHCEFIFEKETRKQLLRGSMKNEV